MPKIGKLGEIEAEHTYQMPQNGLEPRFEACLILPIKDTASRAIVEPGGSWLWYALLQLPVRFYKLLGHTVYFNLKSRTR